MGKLSTWTLTKIVEGSYPLAKIDFQPDIQVASFLRFDSTSRTITFDARCINDDQDLVGKVFFVWIRLIDSNGNFSLQALPIKL